MPWCALPRQLNVRGGPDEQCLLRHVQPPVPRSNVARALPLRERRDCVCQRMPPAPGHVPTGQIHRRGLRGKVHKWVFVFLAGCRELYTPTFWTRPDLVRSFENCVCNYYYFVMKRGGCLIAHRCWPLQAFSSYTSSFVQPLPPNKCIPFSPKRYVSICFLFWCLFPLSLKWSVVGI